MKVLNLDKLDTGVEQRKLRIKEVDYVVEEMTVSNFIETTRVAEPVGAVDFDLFVHFIGAGRGQATARGRRDELEVRGGIGNPLALGHDRGAGLAGVIGRAALKRRNRRSRGGPSRRQQHPHTRN